jgi:hypothetical protein
MGNINLFVDDEDMAAAEAASQFSFEVPPDAVSKGNLKDLNDSKAQALWIQHLEIVESKMYEDTAKDKDGNTYPCIVAEVKFQVPSNGMRVIAGQAVPDPNAGRSMTQWFRIVPAAMKNKAHPKYKANNFANGKLLGIARSIWGTAVIPHGVKTDLANFFDPAAPGTNAAVVGGTVVTNLRQNRYEGKLRDELTDFVPKELQVV